MRSIQLARPSSAFFVCAFVAIPLLAFSACTIRKPNRAPSSSLEVRSLIPVPTDLAIAVEQFRDYISSEKFTAENCGPFLSEVYDRVYRIDAKHFDKEKAVRDADKIITSLWDTKLVLRRRLGGFLDRNELSKECIDSARNILRAGRFMEDMVGFLKLKPAPFDKKKVREAYNGSFPHTLVNPDIGKLEFKSGDILLSRGTAFTSAAIARIGDVDAQFSHLAILYIDEKTGKKYTVEAHIEIGVKVFTLEEYLKDGKARALVFRHHDGELAHLAAKRMYEVASKATAAGENIPYDFGMVPNEASELFCSEVVQYAYSMAAKELGRDFQLPLFSTGINMRNRQFLDNLGVRVNSTFAPADIEVDPRVELVAEWRDFSRVRLLHHHYAVLLKVYEWMERHDYTMRTDLFTYLKKHIFWSMRRWPLFSELLKDKFPKNMSSNALGTVFNLNSIAGTLFEEIERADAEYTKMNGLPMAQKNLEEHLEMFRETDLKVYREYRDECQRAAPGGEEGNHCILPLPKFHWDFRPANED